MCLFFEPVYWFDGRSPATVTVVSDKIIVLLGFIFNVFFITTFDVLYSKATSSGLQYRYQFFLTCKLHSSVFESCCIGALQYVRQIRVFQKLLLPTPRPPSRVAKRPKSWHCGYKTCCRIWLVAQKIWVAGNTKMKCNVHDVEFLSLLTHQSG
jgi:hypothetical protein